MGNTDENDPLKLMAESQRAEWEKWMQEISTYTLDELRGGLFSPPGHNPVEADTDWEKARDLLAEIEDYTLEHGAIRPIMVADFVDKILAFRNLGPND